MKPLGVTALAFFMLAVIGARALTCNEAVCASVVSKCMLTQSCKCDLTHCSCCIDCFHCLSSLYEQCCACVDMCPSIIESSKTPSHFTTGEFTNAVPALFSALTSETDPQNRWRTASFPVRLGDISLQSVEEDASSMSNCTVAYMCLNLSFKKCRSSCESMGSSKYRWHEGCCECFGETCNNTGSEESRCLSCAKDEETFVDDGLEDEFDYGEDMEPQSSDSYT